MAMPFTEDLSPFFDTAGFAQAATLNALPVTGIFDSSTELVLDGVLSQAPAFTARSSETASAAAGQLLVVDGTTYRVRQVLRLPPDGAITQLVLGR